MLTITVASAVTHSVNLLTITVAFATFSVNVLNITVAVEALSVDSNGCNCNAIELRSPAQKSNLLTTTPLSS